MTADDTPTANVLPGGDGREGGINWKLIDHLKGKPHSNLNEVPLPADTPMGVGEVLQEAVIAHHLLDMANIPQGRGYDADLDARVYQAVRAVQRLSRIAEAHAKDVGPNGMTSGDCTECGHAWPCPTYVWATEDRNPGVDCWHPLDDEVICRHLLSLDECAVCDDGN